MSPFLLYALVPADQASAATSAAGGVLSAVSEGSIAVLYDQREDLPSGSREQLVTFERVVSDICRTGPALPVRFGSVVEDLRQVRDLVREREDQWRQRLDVVAGHVEMVIHACDDTAPRPSPVGRGQGREYLLSRARAQHHAERLYTDLVGALGAHCRETRRLTASDEIRVACLVPEAEHDGLSTLVKRWASASEGRHATMTGPWPPFSFTQEDAADELAT